MATVATGGHQHLAEARRSARPLARLQDAVQRTITLTPTGLATLVIALALWGVGRFVAGRPLYLMAYGAVGLVGLAWFLARRGLPLKAERGPTRTRVKEGERLELSVTLHASRSLTNLVVSEKLPLALGQQIELPLAAISPATDVALEYGLTCWRRGAYTLGPLVAIHGDPIGLTVREQEVASPVEVVVHPYYEPVSDRPLTRQFEDPPIRPPVSKPWPSGLEFYGMRDFRPGDDMRRIVWRAVARTGRILVREAEQGITDRITVVLDTDQAGYGDLDYSLAFETGVQAAASLGVRHLREGYQVTLEVNRLRLTPPLRGGARQIPLLDSLARIQPDRTPLAEVLGRLVNNSQRDAHNVLITPRLTRADAAQLRLLLDRGVSVLVVALTFDDVAAETIQNAAALGCQVVEIRPRVPLAQALRAEIGAGFGRR